MSYDFDAPVNRRGSGSDKWDSVESGVIPLWVADMDFAAPDELTGVLAARAAHPFYGYNRRRPEYLGAILSWYKEQYGVSLAAADILPGSGTVLTLGMAVRAFTKAEDGVLIMAPVYAPFYRVIKENHRKVIEAPMILDKDGHFVLDRAVLEKALDGAAAQNRAVPLVFFCSPHNPGGRVWTEGEIKTFLDFAKDRNLIVIADEIHGDFVYPKEPGGTGTAESSGFVSATSFSDHADRIVTVSGANKSFNLGGLHVSHIIVRDEKLRAAMNRELQNGFHREPDVFAELAVETCYTKCAPWLLALKPYLRQNLEETAAFLKGIPGINAWVPGGTYLLWAGIQGLVERTGCKTDLELVNRLEKEAKVKITHGSLYGTAGAGYARINIASPRKLLLEGLGRIKEWAEHP
ncbi:MAG: aminotransferase class I/II-fold pyridoxal phosphate-dependent enzyme [Spirochaetaceae bacterium]|jgi:cystathionine beta-lyase|nr:aminotransferase class I/II-fold pyridoxal phosphate-dependent enzyme [Spirochaetaceae bacterium]